MSKKRFGGYPSAGERHEAELAERQERERTDAAKRVAENNAQWNAGEHARQTLALEQQAVHAATMGVGLSNASTGAKTLDDLVLDYQRTHPGTSTADAIRKVQATYPHLGRAHNVAFSLPVTTTVAMPFENPPSTAPTGTATRAFDVIVSNLRKADPTLSYADAIIRAGHENPSLALKRNSEISIPVGPGGVAMTQV
jgi:hypothetical protein